MAHKTLINGTAYEVTGGRTLIDGTGYSIAGGRTLVNGTGYDISFGTPISSLPVGSSVYLNESGSPVEYLLVNHGIPSNSNLYDSSCDGTWLLRKHIYELRQWHSSYINDYENSDIHSYLNSTFLNLFDANIRAHIKTVKIPYRAGYGEGTTITSGANGLSAKIFLLSSSEVSISFVFVPSNEGADLSYFSGCEDSSADDKRIANLNGSATGWWLRSPICLSDLGSKYVAHVQINGAFNYADCPYSLGIRPALILPSNAVVDSNFNVTS